MNDEHLNTSSDNRNKYFCLWGPYQQETGNTKKNINHQILLVWTSISIYEDIEKQPVTLEYLWNWCFGNG